ncbi:spermatogenesis-associated serine-rich protein 1 isoform X2 [Prionailurus iriomotensis]
MRDFLESKGCFAGTTSSGRKVSPSSSAETCPSVSEPAVPGKVSVHLDSATDLDLKSSSAHSDQSSETSFPEVPKDKYPKEFSLLKLQTATGTVLNGRFTRGLAAISTPTTLESSASLTGSSSATGGLYQREWWTSALGGRSMDIDPRNGIPKLTPGDNPYMYPEQSKGFHKAGSTLPPVNFSIVPYEKKFDTFIPLEPLPQIPILPFWVKEKANRLKTEIREVEELDNWHPAVPLVHSLFPAGGLKNLQRIV